MYAAPVTSEEVRNRLYDAYASTHAGLSDYGIAELSCRRDIAPHLPADRSARILDLGCGQGELVRVLLRMGYGGAEGIDISPEQVSLAHQSGIGQVRLGDCRTELAAGSYQVITATDFLEHLTKDELVEAVDAVFTGLADGGRFIARVPNSVSPFVGNYRYGDLTHETSFTARSLRQLGATVGFSETETFACPPIVHGLPSLLRAACWKVASGAMKAVLAAETGAVRGHVVTQNVVAVMTKG